PVERSSGGVAERQGDPRCSDAIGRGERQLTLRLEPRKQRARRVLRLLHVRLVERVDAQERTGDSRRDFPAYELGAERRGFLQLDLEDRRLRLLEGADVGVALLLGIRAVKAKADEESIVAV